MIVVKVFVHPVNIEAHPTLPPGWRWAVTLGDGPPDDLNWCINAHWAPTREIAELEGDRNLATAVRALQMLNQPARYGGVVVLDTDPLQAGADRLNTV